MTTVLKRTRQNLDFKDIPYVFNISPRLVSLIVLILIVFSPLRGTVISFHRAHGIETENPKFLPEHSNFHGLSLGISNFLALTTIENMEFSKKNGWGTEKHIDSYSFNATDKLPHRSDSVKNLSELINSSTSSTKKIWPTLTYFPGGVSAGLTYWFDAQDLDGDGMVEGNGEAGLVNGEVETWVNKVPGGPNFTSTFSSEPSTTKPNYVIDAFNFNAGIAFNMDGSLNDYLGSAVANFPTAEITQFIVFRTNDQSGGDKGVLSYGLDGVGEERNEFSIVNPANASLYVKGSVGSFGTTNLASATTEMIAVTRKASNNFSSLYRKGNLPINLSQSTMDFDPLGYVVLGQIQDLPGAGFDDAKAFQGSIAEVITYNRVLTSQEHQQVSSYLAVKYGITYTDTGSAHSPIDPYYYSSNGVIIHSHDFLGVVREYIVGLARDDDSGLEQLKSKNSEPGAILTVEANGQPENLEYLTLAALDAPSSPFDPEPSGNLSAQSFQFGGAGMVRSRLSRFWVIQEKSGVGSSGDTGSGSNFGSIDVTFDLSGVPYKPSEVRLVLDPELALANVNFITSYIPTFDGDLVTFSGIDVSDSMLMLLILGGSFPGGALGDLKIWFDGKDLDADGVDEGGAESGQSGNTVSAWSNKMNGESLDAITSNEPVFQTDAMNFNPSLEFETSGGAFDYLRADGGEFPTDDFTAFFVLNTSSQSSEQTIFTVSSGSDIQFSLSNPAALEIYSKGITQSTNVNLAEGSPAILSLERTASSGNVDVYLNGTLIQSYLLGSGSLESLDPAFAIGPELAALTSANAFEGEISELIVFDEKLDISERIKLESYLALKYGISKSYDQPYTTSNGVEVWRHDEDVFYPYGIAGIGRDDSGGIYQPKSKNTGANAILEIATSAGFGLDGTFMHWSRNNDNPKINEVTGPFAGSRRSKLGGFWRIQEKNNVNAGSNIGTPYDIGTVDITFDLTGIQYTQGDVKLIIDDDGVFGSGTIITGATPVFNGDLVTFSTGLLQDGYYLSLQLQLAPEPFPGNVSTDLIYWLDAQDIDGDGFFESSGESGVTNEQVDTWVNKAGPTDFNSTFSQESGTTQPDLAQRNANFNPSVEFNLTGSLNDYMGAVVGDHPTSAITQFIVMKSESTRSSETLISLSEQTGSLNDEWVLNQTNQLNLVIDDTQTSVTPNIDLSTNELQLIGIDWTGATGVTNVYQNGGTGVSAGPTMGTLPQNGYLILGQNQDTPGAGFDDSKAFQGSIAEVITYNSVLNATDRQKVNSYLALKYGFDLGNGTPMDYLASNGIVIWDASEDVVFDHHVAGIGRDYSSGLSQMESKNQRNGALLTIESSSGFLGGEGFLIWSTDNQDISMTSTIQINGQDHVKAGRAWRFQEKSLVENASTGIGQSTDLGLVDIAIDMTGLSFDPFAVRLLTDSDNLFGVGTTVLPNVGTYDSKEKTIKFSDVNLSDGQFLSISLGRLLGIAPGGVSTNLQYWYDAKDLNADGLTDGTSEPGLESGEVVHWANKVIGSSLSYEGVLTENGTKPDFIENHFNFNPGVEFNLNGSLNDYLRSQVIDFPTTGITQFVVMKSASAGTSEGVFSYGGDDVAEEDDEWLLANPNSLNVYAGGSATNSSLDFSSGKLALLTVSRLSSTGETKVYQNGSIISYSALLNAGVSLNAEGYMVLGQDQDGPGDTFSDVNAYQGSIAEVITYNTVLGANDQHKVESYLALKYGFELTNITRDHYLASNGVTIWDGSQPGVSFRYGMAGIGRDDASGLLQLKSKHQSNDAVLTIEKASGTLGNGDFLTWSHNADAMDEIAQTTLLNGLPHNYIKRFWAIQSKNFIEEGSTGVGQDTDIGPVNITIDFSGLSYDLGSIRLINNSAPSVPIFGTVKDQQITFPNVSLADGDLLALVSQVSSLGITPGGVSSGLKYWFDANDMDANGQATGSSETTINSGVVNAWANKIFGPHLAYEGGLAFGGTKPSFIDANFNYNPSVQFNLTGSSLNDYLRTSVSDFPTQYITQYFILKSSGTGNTGSLFSYGGDDLIDEDDEWLITNSNSISVYASSSSIDSGLGLGDTEVKLLRVSRDASTGSTDVYVSGETPYSTTLNSGAALDPDGFIVLGQEQNSPLGDFMNSDAFKGSIAEVITYDRLLNATEQQKVESYLLLKYGVTTELTDVISSDGTVVWDVTDAGAYSNNITGIGRDDLTGLYQKQSKNSKADTFLSIGLDSEGSPDGLETSNWLNPSTIFNGNLTIWADDGAALEAPSSSPAFYEKPVGTAVKSRLNREWRMENTLGPSAINSHLHVEFDVSQLPGPGMPGSIGTNDESQIVLLVDADGDFAQGAVVFSQTLVNNSDGKVRFNLFFPEGESYFTLGSGEELALPVTLVSFEAEMEEDHVRIAWSTASESEGTVFRLERSNNGYDFEEIESLAGRADNSGVKDYYYQDFQASKGLNFYRLVDLDAEGVETFSEIISVQNDMQAKQSSFAYPNPVKRGEELSIKFSDVDLTDVRIRVFGTDAKAFYPKFRVDGNLILLSTEGLKSGLFLLRTLLENGTAETFKFIVND